MNERSITWPRPKGALLGLLIAIGALWLIFALAINWAGQGEAIYGLLLLDPARLWRGEVWRPFTAPLMHLVSGHGGVSHLVTNALMLYFFGAPLQQAWGNRRFGVLLVAAALGGEALQLGLGALLPAGVGAQGVMLGSGAMAFGVTIAWGLSNRTQRVALMFALPVGAMTLVWITVGMAVLGLIAVGAPPEGLFAPFGGMLCGYLLAGDPTPLRKFLLRRKLQQIEKKGASKAPHLRVVKGGADDKKWLN
jgi:membrane associated rhomboid family serine protease